MKGERIVVTGAGRGIGRAVASRLAAGRTLVLVGRDAAGLAGTAQEVASAGGEALVRRCDLAVAAEVEALADELAGAPLHALVNNAGMAVVRPHDEVATEEWQRSLAVNVTAPFLLCRRLAGGMPAGASIVNLLSIAARAGIPGWSAYCAAKFALEGWSQSVREELRPRGVRVVNIYPAATATELWDQVGGSFPRERMLEPGEVAEAVAYALARPPGVLLDTLSIGHLSGRI